MKYGSERLKPFTRRELPPVDVLVSGPPSSGTRLVVRLLAESGHSVRHDSSHGVWNAGAAAVVTTSRDRAAHTASLVARKMGDASTIDVAVDRIAEKYGKVPCVSFEALIADRDAELARIAKLLGWAPWVSTIEVSDENRKHLS